MDASAQSAAIDNGSFVSPSLAGVRGGVRAFEVKFVLDEATAAAVESRLASWLTPDPHTDPATGTYDLTSIYCDTPAWDMYFREGPHSTRKYRVRRYGAAGPLFLERKTARKSMVRKRRTAVNGSDVGQVLSSDAPTDSAWFVQQVHRAGLVPVCTISYARRAFFGQCRDGPMRVTFDRHIRGRQADGWSFNGSAPPPDRPLLAQVIVCEFKFRDAMPGPMKDAVAALRLEPRGVSKYRACIAAWAGELGLPGEHHA